MADLINSLLGDYQFKYDSAGNLIGGLAGLDYEWLFGAGLFLVCLIGLFCILRTLIAHWF